MDFSKLQAQRAAKEQADDPLTLLHEAYAESLRAKEEEAKTAAKAKRDARPPSKRQGWKAATFYVRPETLAQLRRVVGLRKLEGATGDLSDAVEEALQAWLNQADQG